MGGLVALTAAARASRDRLAWGMTACVLLVLFGSEVSALHVEVDRVSYGKLVYLPLLIVLALSVRRLARIPPAASLARAALVTLVGAYAIHLFGHRVIEALGWGAATWPYQLKVGLKEGGELAGWLLLLVALWRMAQPGPRATSTTG